jgi:hypothetical protein
MRCLAVFLLLTVGIAFSQKSSASSDSKSRVTAKCKVIHGRAHLYGGDGQLRIWHIGTHHEYQPDDSSWPVVVRWLEAGIGDKINAAASPISNVSMFADFLVCPVEPLKKGAVQTAIIKSATHRKYLRVK